MIEINLENKWVNLAIDAISTVIGMSAAGLVGSLFTPTIDNYTGVKKTVLEAGRLGIETVVTYEVASTMHDEITDYVSRYDQIAAEINAGRRAMKENEEVNNA